MQISRRLRHLLKRRVRTVVLTGAGVSAESGVPTFRGDDGLWRKFKPEELATIDAFLDNPEIVWEWYLFRRNLVEDVKPNPGHYTLAEMEKKIKNFTLITQNVDGLHRRAGSENIIELHGNIMRNKCFNCNRPIEEVEISPDQIPLCNCGGKIRPDVVWFGELLPTEAIRIAELKSMEAELFLSVGTSAQVYPAAQLPITAKECGAYLVEINPTPTRISKIADETFLGNSGELLPLIWEKAGTNEG